MNNPIATINQPFCPICGQNGEPLYRQLRDQLYGVEGQWNVSQCRSCIAAWLDPRPNDFVQLYDRYYTHQPDSSTGLRDRLRRWLSRASVLAGRKSLGYPTNAPVLEKFVAGLIGFFRPGREMAQMHFAAIPSPAFGSVLDVGCGSGSLLAALTSVGWDAVGIEIDAQAVAAARALGVEVHQGTLNSVTLESGRFAYIVLNHVIEHVPDSESYLRECARLLAPDGRLVVITPNIEGFAHRVFGKFWRGLEIPRHLVLFSPKSLAAAGAAAGLKVEKSLTLIRGARFMYAQSARMRAGLMGIELGSRTGLIEKIYRIAMGYTFQAIEWISVQIESQRGDEILMYFSAPKNGAQSKDHIGA